MRRQALVTPLFLALAVACRADSIDSQLDDYFNKAISEHRSPSFSVAVVTKGKLTYSKGFGFADIENEVPSTPQTVYRIGSITKQFTATMIMQLVQEGKLKLDGPYRKTLPETPEPWSKITVRQLLNHTSGLKNYTKVKGLFEDAVMKPVTPAGIIKTVEKDALEFEPGTKWNYCNTGYELLGMLIEKLDGRPYAKSLKARILDPLGMNTTYFVSERALVKHRATGYSPSPDGFIKTTYLNMDWPFAAGSIETTTLDLAKWDAALYGDKILPQSALAQMWTPTPLADGKTKDYGFGWGLGKENGVPIISHGGGINGFVSFIRRAPSKGVTVIVLINSDGANPDGFAMDAMGIVDPSLKHVEIKGTLDKNAQADAFARKTLQSVLDGTLDRTTLTPAFDKILTKELEEGAKSQLGALGKISAFELTDVKEKDGGHTRTYHVVLGTSPLTMVLNLDKAGKIEGLGLRP